MTRSALPSLAGGLLAALLLGLGPSSVAAQNLEPRLYVPYPVSQNLVGTTIGYSEGDVIFDASLPISGVEADVRSLSLAYVRTFGLFGRSAQVQAVAPYVDASYEGSVAGRDSSREMQGFADPQLRIAVNLAGGPARTRAEMAGAQFKTIVGTSLTLSLPLGVYEEERVLNIGANRWSLKPEVGVVRVLGRSWALEGYVGVWVFGHNTAYLDSLTAAQDPLWTIQTHVVHLFGRKAWVALDGTWVTGGTTKVDGVVTNSFQRSSRLGATGGWLLGGGHQLKANLSTGVYTRLGGDFTSATLGYSYAWGQ